MCGAIPLIIGTRGILDASVAGDAAVVLSYSLKAALSIREATGRMPQVVDPTAQARQIEDQAWRWSEGLVAALVRASSSEREQAILRTMTRSLLLRVFMPIATARHQAQQAATLVGARQIVHVVGATGSERIELERQGLVVVLDSGDTARCGECEGDNSGDSGAHETRLEKVIRITLRVLRNMLSNQKRLHSRRHELRAAAGSGQPALLAAPAVPIHLDLMASSLAAARAKGWPVTAMLMSDSDALAAKATEMGLACVRFTDFTDTDITPLELMHRQYIRPRLIKAITAWAETSGLGEHSQGIAVACLVEYFSMRNLVRTHNRVLAIRRPDIVLAVSEIVPGTESMVPAARRRSVPIVLVQHGAINDMPIFNDFKYDAFCVFGDAYREVLESRGTAAESIRVVGNPFTDGECEDSRVSARSGVARSQSRLQVLFAAGYACATVSDESLRETLDMVLTAVEQDAACDVVVKLHPVGSGLELGYTVALADHPDAPVRVTRDANLYDLIQQSDCVVTHGSTVAIEAASFGVPSILLSLHGAPDVLPLVSEGVAMRATDVASLLKCLHDICEDGRPVAAQFEEFNRRYSWSQDGAAGQRILGVCEELAGRQTG